MTTYHTVSQDTFHHPENQELLAVLSGYAEHSIELPEAYIQKTHPDLEERLYLAAANLPSKCKKQVYGYSVLIARSGIIIGVAMGTSSLAFRLSASALSTSATLLIAKSTPLFPPDFIAFDPWNIDVPTKQWIGDLQYWCELAYEHQ